MRKEKKPWWGYVKAMIRAYPERCGKPLNGTALQEFSAVRAAIEKTEQLRDGSERLQLIDMVFWKQTHLVAGAAQALYVSERTAAEWHRDFIKQTAAAFVCDGLKG